MRSEAGDSLSQDLDSIIDRRSAFLADYQDQDYAARYRDLVAAAAAAETAKAKGFSGFAEAVARNLLQAARLQGRVRSRPALYLRGFPGQAQQAVRGRFSGQVPLGATALEPASSR